MAKVRDLEEMEVRECLGMICAKAANMLGIKEKINEINKADIREMVLTKFKGLSLEEIDYAFKLERYGEFETRTEHFQLFGAEYVSEVLNKYRKWLKSTISENRILIEKKPESEITESEKRQLTFDLIVMAFEHFENYREIKPGTLAAYDALHKLGELPEHTEEFKKGIIERAKRRIRKKRERKRKPKLRKRAEKPRKKRTGF